MKREAAIAVYKQIIDSENSIDTEIKLDTLQKVHALFNYTYALRTHDPSLVKANETGGTGSNHEESSENSAKKATQNFYLSLTAKLQESENKYTRHVDEPKLLAELKVKEKLALSGQNIQEVNYFLI